MSNFDKYMLELEESAKKIMALTMRVVIGLAYFFWKTIWC